MATFPGPPSSPGTGDRPRLIEPWARAFGPFARGQGTLAPHLGSVGDRPTADPKLKNTPNPAPIALAPAQHPSHFVVGLAGRKPNPGPPLSSPGPPDPGFPRSRKLGRLRAMPKAQTLPRSLVPGGLGVGRAIGRGPEAQPARPFVYKDRPPNGPPGNKTRPGVTGKKNPSQRLPGASARQWPNPNTTRKTNCEKP